MSEQRERWSSRTAFILAAVGSAIGLGNVWRFPAQAFANGGGAFLIPYFVALLVAGIPLVIAEYALGNRFQAAAPEVYRRLGARFEPVGWWAVAVGFAVAIYYAVIIAWSIKYVVISVSALLSGELAWAGAPREFFATASNWTGDSSGLAVTIIAALAVNWVLVYLSIVKGVMRVGKIVLITVPLPILLLVLMLIRAVTLPGAVNGVAYYLTPDFSALSDPSVWIAAFGQIFFSLSVGWGILIAYSSYLPREADIVNNAFMTSFANCGFSFLAGFVVFATLGFLAQRQGVPIFDLEVGGAGLAFISYPTAIELLPGGPLAQAAFAVALFVMLFTLGIDSAFSIVEAAAASIEDRFGLDRGPVVTGLCVVGFAAGVIFTHSDAAPWFAAADRYVGDISLVLVGWFQAMIVGWWMGRRQLSELRAHINENSDFPVGRWWDFSIRYLIPVGLGIIIALNVAAEVRAVFEATAPPWDAILFGWLPTIGVLALSFAVTRYARARVGGEA